jgi:hypothetical protein
MVRQIGEALYHGEPPPTLYHYTSFRGLMGIVASHSLWASEIRYMNDSAEMRHTINLMVGAIGNRLQSRPDYAAFYQPMLEWLHHRLGNDHFVFAASFRAHGNLLSQWRGYSQPGTGVSLGFNAGRLAHLARLQGFRLGRCLYQPEQQALLIAQLLDSVEELATRRFGSLSGTPPEPELLDLLAEVGSDLLRLAALLKHPSFQEEEEWRLVSPILDDFRKPPVRFREGVSMLVPYWAFALEPASDRAGPLLDHIFLGPTSNHILSMSSLTMYLEQQGFTPSRGIGYSDIPYRQV